MPNFGSTELLVLLVPLLVLFGALWLVVRSAVAAGVKKADGRTERPPAARKADG